ncbi:flagellar biosynthesis anti-sigma factor FlgM [Clostridium saccharobutylicum]|uniref:Negative regulator of flagellin synthesis n=1 Tax=Clostridium saccharobutylicum DSM 13864 TaxID=1345695 RepID=U5MW02_CLOSA|nr:flagellar biosynthesis anti-sigma factor FlgM [Clostridium saccharobutylicum]AGX44934.1 anti-sigma-28 factor, FlgM [Clostridium saccharobutylicum DSM 13864]AQR92216.1 anti-sigma-28 factor, FlgM [Clostridium saccharobutylicum]AQS02118.1 anti-sigma-28 factor, FlgM [Clostridium saccharobutylicum]AQS11722.1 anti-sigma-28 factor, FlgM [Clostridium saccharobutylicum]AQS16101.1 anti-sigma-28 factor, FlgM [Clostridium saccharobutylicum]
MSIERINRQSYINAYNSNSKKTVDKVSKSKEVDRIEISSLGKSIKDYCLDTNVDNTKKIADIKSKIDNGTYNVDARLTARSILNAMKENKS